MTAPHFHTVQEAVSAIKKIGHNDRTGYDGATEGAPTGINGGSGGNLISPDTRVVPKDKGADWVNHRGIKDAG